MLYLLEFKMDRNEEYYVEINVNELNYYYFQELHWTNGHFIIENVENGFITTLVAYPHVEDPCEDLVEIQEYILQKLNISYKNINFMKFVTRGSDEINVKCEVVDSLIIKCLSQDYFFDKILNLSIKRKSSYIAATFFKNYFYEGSFSSSLFEDMYENPEYNKIKLKVKQHIEIFYTNHASHQIPIFILNNHNKNQLIFIKQSIYELMKKQSRLELRKCIYTSINDKTLIETLRSAKTDSFINSILGQIWDINLDLNINRYKSSKALINECLLPIFIGLKSHTLIIIQNQNYLQLYTQDFDNIII